MRKQTIQTVHYEAPQFEVLEMQPQDCILDASDGASIDDYDPTDWVW